MFINHYCSTLQDLISIFDEEIILLDFQNIDDKVLTLNQSYQALLCVLQGFVRYNISENITDYTPVTSDNYDTYCIEV